MTETPPACGGGRHTYCTSYRASHVLLSTTTLTNRCCPRPYRDCRAISHLLLWRVFWMRLHLENRCVVPIRCPVGAPRKHLQACCCGHTISFLARPSRYCHPCHLALAW